MPKASLCLLLLSAVFLSNNANAKLKNWHHYTSENFSIYTDVSERKTRQLINQFEDFRDLILSITGVPAPVSQERMQIYLFSRSQEFYPFAGSKNLAGFYTHTIGGPRIVMADGAGGHSSQSVLFHEYVHHIMRGSNNFNYPMWYSEGFADFLGATQLKHGKAHIGARADGRIWNVHGRPRIAELLVADRGQTEADDRDYWARFYAKSWLFVHFLQMSKLNGDAALGQSQRDYLLRYAAGEDPLEAFSAAFGMSPEDMDQRLNRYMNQRSFVFVREMPKKERRINKTPLPRNLSLFLLAELAVQMGQNEHALSFLQQLDRHSADAAPGLSLLGRLSEETDPAAADALLDLALQLNPHDPVVLRNHASVQLARYGQTAQHEASEPTILQTIKVQLQAAAAASPKDIEIQRMLWAIADAQNDVIEAAQYMMAAYGLDQNSTRLNYEVGRYLLRQQRPDLALSFLERVYRWTHDETFKREMEMLLGQVRQAIEQGGTLVIHEPESRRH